MQKARKAWEKDKKLVYHRVVWAVEDVTRPITPSGLNSAA